MRKANLIMCLKEVLATSHNHLISTQRSKAENSIVNINLLFSKILNLRHKTYIIPSGLYAMELNSNEYRLFEAFSLFIYRQLDWDFFLYKGLLFSDLKFDKCGKYLYRKGYNKEI